MPPGESLSMFSTGRLGEEGEGFTDPWQVGCWRQKTPRPLSAPGHNDSSKASWCHLFGSAAGCPCFSLGQEG